MSSFKNVVMVERHQERSHTRAAVLLDRRGSRLRSRKFAFWGLLVSMAISVKAFSREPRMVARGGLVNYDVDYGRFGSDDDTGLFVGARLRTEVAPKIEVEAGVEHFEFEVDGLDGDTYIIGEARYNFTSQWSAGKRRDPSANRCRNSRAPARPLQRPRW